MSVAYDGTFRLEKLIELTRRLGRIPNQGDLLIAAKSDSVFPSEKAFRRLGSKPRKAAKVIAFCDFTPGLDDVSAIWKKIVITEQSPEPDEAGLSQTGLGYVYLLKHGCTRVQDRPDKQPNPA